MYTNIVRSGVIAISFIVITHMTGCNEKSRTDAPPTPGSTDTAAQSPKPALPPSNFKSEMANVNGVNIHYVIGGQGEPLVLIHGFGQNWFMWNRILPELSKHFTIIAPDLRGVGESDKPA